MSVVRLIYQVVKKEYVHESPTRVRILQYGDDLQRGDLLRGFQVPLSTLFDECDEKPEPAK